MRRREREARNRVYPDRASASASDTELRTIAIQSRRTRDDSLLRLVALEAEKKRRGGGRLSPLW